MKMQDIARQAGVSIATVSVILSGKGEKLRISAQTRSRVLAIADQSGYCRNEIARSVATGRSNAIGFLVRNPASEFCARLFDGIMRAAHASDFFVKVMYAKPGRSAEEIVRACVGQGLAGMIGYELLDNDFFDELRSQTARHHIPLVLAAGHHGDTDQGTRILAGNHEGGKLAFKHLH